jgi:hypothetical protein
MRGSYQYIIISHIIFDAVNLPRDSSGRGAIGVYISSDSSAGIPTHLRFTGCEIKNAPASGLLVEAAAGAPSDIQILNCSMHDNGANILDHGIYISGNNVLVDHCRIYNNQGFGVQIYDGTTNSSSVCSNNVISNNIIYGNARYNSGGAGIIVDTGDNNVVYNNVIYNNNNGYGIRVDAQAKGTLIYNNTVTGNPSGALLIGYDDSTTSGTVVRNNILYHNGRYDIMDYGTGTIADHNTLNGAEPLFIDAVNNNYQVQAGSPAIDAGLTLDLVTVDINGMNRPAGSYTIGAYQYAATGVYTVLGGTGNDVFTVTALSATPLHIDGLAGTNTLNFDGQGQHAVGTIPGELTMNSTLGVLTYANVQNVNLNNAASVDAFYGPDTADRGTALPGLTAAERFVQVLYLNALGRAGSKAEIDGWAAAFGGSSSSNAPIQAAIARGIEGSMEGRDHEVKSWYAQYLGRAATGGEEMAWVNMLMAGQTEESVLSHILGSTEFFNRAQTLGFGGSADSRFVQALYELLLHRAGGAAEVAGWVGALPTIGHGGAALGFLDSGEFRTDQFEGYYNALLHRPAESAGLNGWVGAGIDVFTTRVDFETSSEFFSNG